MNDHCRRVGLKSLRFDDSRSGPMQQLIVYVVWKRLPQPENVAQILESFAFPVRCVVKPVSTFSPKGSFTLPSIVIANVEIPARTSANTSF